MKTKQISKMLAPLSGIMSFMFAMGVMTVPVSAQEINMANSAYEESVKTDYTTYINSTVEKNGFKVTINKLTAAKNRMNVTTTIEFPNEITDESLNNSIFMFTVKKSKLESDWGNRRIINDKTVEVNFDITGFEDLPLNADLRFDVIIPEYNLNAWVNVNADLSKNIDKIIEKDKLRSKYIGFYNHLKDLPKESILLDEGEFYGAHVIKFAFINGLEIDK